MLIRARAGGHRVHFGVFGFIRVRPEGRRVRSGASLGSSGSFGFDGLICARSGGRGVHSFAFWGYLLARPGGRWVDAGALYVSSGSFWRVVEFIPC